MKEYLKKSKDILLTSFRDFLDPKTIFIVLYDLVFVSIFLLSLLIFGKTIQNKSLTMAELPESSQLINLPTEELSKISSELQGFLFTIVISFLLMLLVIFIAMCIFKGLIWFKVAKKEFTINHLKKFTLINFIWYLAWLILLIILFVFLKQEIIAPLLIIILILLIHFTNILYVLFTDNQKLNIIKKALNLGVKKIHLFIIPYIITPILFLIIMQVFWLFIAMPENIQTVLVLLVLLIYFAWLRIYLYAIIKNIDKNY